MKLCQKALLSKADTIQKINACTDSALFSGLGMRLCLDNVVNTIAHTG
jgi:hypothetical protein